MQIVMESPENFSYRLQSQNGDIVCLADFQKIVWKLVFFFQLV